MTDPNAPKSPANPRPQTGVQGQQRKAQTLARQAAALRENLARRKQQSRARADLDEATPEPDGSEVV